MDADTVVVECVSKSVDDDGAVVVVVVASIGRRG